MSKLKTISESISSKEPKKPVKKKSIKEAYTSQNISISKNELRFESLGTNEQKILDDVFGDAWNGDDLVIDFKKVAAMRKRVG